jgi:hypothetical protein
MEWSVVAMKLRFPHAAVISTRQRSNAGSRILPQNAYPAAARQRHGTRRSITKRTASSIASSGGRPLRCSKRKRRVPLALPVPLLIDCHRLAGSHQRNPARVGMVGRSRTNALGRQSRRRSEFINDGRSRKALAEPVPPGAPKTPLRLWPHLHFLKYCSAADVTLDCAGTRRQYESVRS